MSDLHNIEAEQALLGALIFDSARVVLVSNTIKAEHFFEPLHAKIYTAVLKLAQDVRIVTPTLLEPFLKNEEHIGELTAIQYIGRLAATATTTIGAPAYARQIRDYADRRAIADAGLRLQQLAGDIDTAVPQIVADTNAVLDALTSASGGQKRTSVSDTVSSAMSAIRSRNAAGCHISGLSTGFRKIDELIDGLRPSTLTIIGARPKQGKTGFLLSMIRNLCRAGKRCALFSLEMPEDQIVQRLIAMEANIDFGRLSRGRYYPEEEHCLADAAATVAGWPLMIDDDGSLTASGISARARTEVFAHKADVVFIDYLQRIAPEKDGKRYEEVTATSMAIADLRKKLKVPIIAAAQLNRKLADRSDKIDFKKFRAESTRPTDGDLRDSGQIEQDADALLFINRPIVQLEMMKPTDESAEFEWEAACNSWRNRAEIIVHYNRAGCSGISNFKFIGPQMRFEEI
jgi:replicative DNA helicase